MANEAVDKQMYHVSKAGAAEGESLGPWTIEVIAEQLAKTEIAITDFVYDDQKEDWVALVEFEPLKEHLRRAKPKKAPPKAAAHAAGHVAGQVATAPKVEAVRVEPVAVAQVEAVAPSHEELKQVKEQVAHQRETQEMAMATRGPNGEWFVQKGTQRHGPFSYLSLIRALQDKSVYEFDFVWTQGMESWTRLAEHEEFTPERIRQMSEQNAKAGGEQIFAQRAHPRVRFESEVIVHDDKSAWMGRAFEGSIGGSGLVIENAALYPGQTLRLHFSPTDGMPAFNVVAEIVNKKFTKNVRGVHTPVQYAVRFIEMDEAAKKHIQSHFGKQAA